MSVSGQALGDVLREQAGLYETLLGILGREEGALARGATAEVAECVTLKEALSHRLRLVEERRWEVVQRLAGRGDAPLSAIRGADTGDVAEARARLRLVLENVQRANRRVEALVARTLTRIARTLDHLRDVVGADRQYTADARLVSSAVRRIDGSV